MPTITTKPRTNDLVYRPYQPSSGESQYGGMADAAARKYGLDPLLFRAVITQESAWNPSAVSSAGARGLTQVVPRWHPTANLSTPQTQLDYGAKHLSELVRKYGNNRDALAVYNSGKPWATSQAYGETNNYVTRILAAYKQRGGAGGGGVTGPVNVGANAATTGATALSGGGAWNPQPLNTEAQRLIHRYVTNSQNAVLNNREVPDVLPVANAILAIRNRYSIDTPNYQTTQPQATPMQAATGGLGPGGGWGGTQTPVLNVTSNLPPGFTVTSEKRDRRNTASGGVSDHWSGSKTSYARDIGWGSSTPTSQSDAVASRIVQSLGGPRNWGRTGGNFVTTVNGIRWQVIYRSNVGGNHYNHIHVGARRV